MDEGTTITVDLSAPDTYSEEPTPRIKFIGGKLHQAFKVIRYKDHRPFSAIEEWRLVPSE